MATRGVPTVPSGWEVVRSRFQETSCFGQGCLKTVLSSGFDSMRWGRPKDLADAGGIMSVRGKTLDWSYIERWCDAHHTRQRLETVKASIPADLIL